MINFADVLCTHVDLETTACLLLPLNDRNDHSRPGCACPCAVYGRVSVWPAAVTQHATSQRHLSE